MAEENKAAAGRVSIGAPSGTPRCPSCEHLTADQKYPGWGWCSHPQNRVYGVGWPNGFTPSQSPTGSCALHPERAVIPTGARNV